MISTSDAGMYYDIHPKEKKVLGHRYFLQAMDKVYGKPGLSEAPEIDKAHVEGNRIILEFKNTGCGLKLLKNPADLFAGYQGDSRMKVTDICVSENAAVLYCETPVTLPVRIEFAQTPYYEVSIVNSAEIPALPARISIGGYA